MKKLLAVVVIVLFLGLAIAPSINANVSKASIDSELVEITTEVCGLKGEKQAVQLTKEDAEEVEMLMDDIERRLDEVETREEAEEIFKEAVVELDKYGLLGWLSVKQAQKLVTGRVQNLRIHGLMDKIAEENDNSLTNFNCIIIGHIREYCYFIRPAIPGLELFVDLFFSMLYASGMMPIIAPAFFRFDIGLGIAYRSMVEPSWRYRATEGSITTVGELGRKNISGDVWGNISKTTLDLGPALWVYYVGIKRFKGFRIYDVDNADDYFIGFAKEVRIDSERPDWYGNRVKNQHIR